MTLLAIDPSSTCTGYALMSDSMTILDAGLFKPQPEAKATEPAIMRVVAMTKDLRELLLDCWPDAVLVEMPHGHDKSGAKRLANYGLAPGAMYWEVCSYVAARLKADPKQEIEALAINAEDWTGGVPKFKRQQNICLAFPHRYDPETDKGGDIADAIGLAVWWFRQQKAQRIAG